MLLAQQLEDYKRAWMTWKLAASRDHPNDSIIENGQYTEKNPWNLRKVAVTQTPVKTHKLMLIWKTLKE